MLLVAIGERVEWVVEILALVGMELMFVSEGTIGAVVTVVLEELDVDVTCLRNANEAGEGRGKRGEDMHAGSREDLGVAVVGTLRCAKDLFQLIVVNKKTVPGEGSTRSI